MLTKKLIFAALLGIFAIGSVSAQSKIDNFLGVWKMIETEGAGSSSTVKSLTLNVSQTGDEIVIDRTAGGVYNNQAYSNTLSSSYKLSGATTTQLVGGRFGGTVQGYMEFFNPHKLRFRAEFQTELRKIDRNVREDWTLSDDGKTLTIHTYSVGRSKTIFTKQ
jgi:ABC-type transport system substrate-binding protein